MRFRRHIKKTKFAFSCIVLFGYAAYTAYALYYFLAFESPLGIALLALVGATLALTAVITFISYRVNLKDRPRPRIQRLIKIVKLTIQLAATALTVIFFVTAARQHSALPWIVSGISAAILLLSLSVNVIAAAIARKYPEGIGRKTFVRGTLLDGDGEEADVAKIIAAVRPSADVPAERGGTGGKRGADPGFPGAVHHRLYLSGSVFAGDAACGSKGSAEADRSAYGGKGRAGLRGASA